MALHSLTLLLCTFSLSLSFDVASSHMASSSSSSCSVVTPSTPLVSFLEQLQETALQTFGNSNFDPKTYVDLPLKFTLSETHQAFQNLPRLSSNGTVSAEVLKGFINRYFKGAGDDLVCWQPHDFVAEPEGFLTKVKHPEVRAWALKVHSLWRNLSRKVSREVEKNPQLHTLLPLPNPVVIPGSRFREVYYWDSYWVIRGLLVSKMHKTATAIVMNLVSLIEKYGFVLNGARQYYTNRSQPPLLSSMIYEIYRITGDIELVKRCLPALLKEHAFWNSDIHRVTIVDAQGHSHNLNRYQAMWNKPRPESSTMDKKSASKFLNISEKQHFYRDIASAAESGWDFSTRWMRVPPDYSTLATTSVIPVDLNAYLLGMEINIAFFAKAIGDETTAKHFMELSNASKKAINSVFWSASKKQWLDY